MGLEPQSFEPATEVPGLQVREACPDDLETVLDFDVGAFGGDCDQTRPWMPPHIGARGFAGGARLAHLDADTDAAARVYARLGFVDVGVLEVFEEA